MKRDLDDETIADLHASLDHARLTLEGIIDLLGAAPKAHMVRVGPARAMLLPVVDQIEQAAMAARALASP